MEKRNYDVFVLKLKAMNKSQNTRLFSLKLSETKKSDLEKMN